METKNTTLFSTADEKYAQDIDLTAKLAEVFGYSIQALSNQPEDIQLLLHAIQCIKPEELKNDMFIDCVFLATASMLYALGEKAGRSSADILELIEFFFQNFDAESKKQKDATA